MRLRLPPRSLVFLGFGLLAVACSKGGSGSDLGGFQLTRISLLDNAVWKVNQEIEFSFSQEVDFSTVSLNTISIQSAAGTPATGTFFQRADPGRSTINAFKVIFQPSCPTQANFSDAGLVPGGVPYLIRVLGSTSGAANTVRSSTGGPLAVTQVRNFTTEESTDAFLDEKPGEPPAVTLAQIQIGAQLFELFPDQDPLLPQIPVNPFSTAAEQVSVLLDFDQALNPEASNISSSLMHFELADTTVLDTRVTLVANCTSVKARVRLDPIGLLPQGELIRVVLGGGIQDLAREGTQVAEDIATFTTTETSFVSLPGDTDADEFAEGFDFGGNSAGSNQDTQATFESPSANWGNGELRAAFPFFEDFTEHDPCAAVAEPQFHWIVSDGEELLIDTDGSTVFGLDQNSSVVARRILGSGDRAGVLDVDSLVIEQRAVVRVQGSNPLRLNVAGTVQIDGLLDLSGFNANDVITQNTGNMQESGAQGGPGAGRGGNANEVVTNSTARGGFGQGPLTDFNGGGQGGESGFAAATTGKDSRRPGGGAGGRFAVTLTDLDGGDGNANATGAQHTGVPSGGSASDGPFTPNSTTDDDFFGVQAIGSGQTITMLVRGELPSLWGGYGGGGGGNACQAAVFPTPGWTAASDEKGGAGGGGGGTLHLRALGSITFGAAGEVRSDGGRGGLGENVIGSDHIGGSGGSGSGGHIVLESAVGITSAKVNARGGPAVRAITGSETSKGGPGGPGVIKLHVPNPVSAPPTGVTASPTAIVLVPTFGSVSVARSNWIPLGNAHKKAAGDSIVSFLFAGTDETTGVVQVDQDGFVDELTPLLDHDLSALGQLSGSRSLLVNDASSLFVGQTDGIDNDLYLRSDSLLEDFVLRLSVGSTVRDFLVASADYVDATDRLTLTVPVDETVGDLASFAAANPGVLHVQLVPRFFRVVTCGQENRLPTSAAVRIRFEGADATQVPIDLGSGSTTSDISEFNTLNSGELRFFRFIVEFDLGTLDSSSTPVGLDFLKIPFVF